MGIFKTIFGNNSKSETDNSFWKKLESTEDFNQAMEESESGRVAIFKHSTRCHISKTVLRNFENEVKNSEKNILYYFLDLLAHRNLSNLISHDLEVEHQSPQLIVIENKKAVKNASHQHISIQLI